MLLLPKVIRRGPARKAGNYRTIQKIGTVFLKNLSYSRTSTQVSDFSGLDMMFAEAHARGFAPL